MSESDPSERPERFRLIGERIAKFKNGPRYKDFHEEMKRFEKSLSQSLGPALGCQHTVFDPNCTECNAVNARFKEAWKAEWEVVVRLFPELDLRRSEENK